MTEQFPIPEDLSIPLWLKAAPGRAPSVCVVTATPLTGETEKWKKREQERRALIVAETRAKNAKGFAKMMAKHTHEKYDRKLKQWVPK